MRISDWSSDVCSSDLLWVLRVEPRPEGHADVSRKELCRTTRARHRDDVMCAVFRYHAQCCVDRKSVVEGKSVSVRVDDGGRRIIQKKKRNKIINRSLYRIHNKKRTRTAIVSNN